MEIPSSAAAEAFVIPRWRYGYTCWTASLRINRRIRRRGGSRPPPETTLRSECFNCQKSPVPLRPKRGACHLVLLHVVSAISRTRGLASPNARLLSKRQWTCNAPKVFMSRVIGWCLSGEELSNLTNKWSDVLGKGRFIHVSIAKTFVFYSPLAVGNSITCLFVCFMFVCFIWFGYFLYLIFLVFVTITNCRDLSWLTELVSFPGLSCVLASTWRNQIS